MENNLKKLRTNRGLYQKDIAKILGIAVSTYSYWENGTNEPDQKSLVKLADYFGVTVDYLLGRTNQPQIEEALGIDQEPKAQVAYNDPFKGLSPDDRKKAEEFIEFLKQKSK